MKQNLRFGWLVFEKTKETSKIPVKYSPPQTFSKALDKGVKAKRDQVSMQAHKGAGGLNIWIPLFTIFKASKNEKPNPILFHNSCFYQTEIPGKHAK